VCVAQAPSPASSGGVPPPDVSFDWLDASDPRTGTVQGLAAGDGCATSSSSRSSGDIIPGAQGLVLLELLASARRFAIAYRAQESVSAHGTGAIWPIAICRSIVHLFSYAIDSARGALLAAKCIFAQRGDQDAGAFDSVSGIGASG